LHGPDFRRRVRPAGRAPLQTVEVRIVSRQRYCSACGADVTCKEAQGTVPGSLAVRVRLSCPNCGKVLGVIYDPQLEIRPVANAKISRG
jgi:predicted RNA-binding Zn-ribbon protein involved in translation (DUF1610 family)